MEDLLEIPETPERKIELLKIQSYDAWVGMQVAALIIKEQQSIIGTNQVTMRQNAQKIAEMEEELNAG